jgi:hypothetical protein
MGGNDMYMSGHATGVLRANYFKLSSAHTTLSTKLHNNIPSDFFAFTSVILIILN